MQDLGTLYGGGGAANGVNDALQVTGVSLNLLGWGEAFLFSGALQALGMPAGFVESWGYRVNGAGSRRCSHRCPRARVRGTHRAP